MQERKLSSLAVQLRQLNLKTLKRIDGFPCQRLGFGGPSRFVEEISMEIFEGTHLRGGKFDLRLQNHVAVDRRAMHLALQRVPFQHIASAANFQLATRAQQGQIAQDSRVVPTVRLACKTLQQLSLIHI